MTNTENWSRHCLGWLEMQPQRSETSLSWLDIAELAILAAMILALGLYGPALLSHSWL